MWGQPQTGSEVYQNHRTYSWNAWKSGWRKHGIYSGSSVVISEKEGAKGNAGCNGICTVHTILPTDIIRVDFPKLCEESVGGRGIRWRYSWLILEGEVQRELMPMMPVLMYSVPRMLWSGREISVSCLWDLDASPDTGFYFWKLEGAWYGGFWFHWEIRRTSSQRFSLILNGRFCRSYCKL